MRAFTRTQKRGLLVNVGVQVAVLVAYVALHEPLGAIVLLVGAFMLLDGLLCVVYQRSNVERAQWLAMIDEVERRLRS